MLHRKTKRMAAAQIGNLITVVVSISLLVTYFPAWNGVNGSIAASPGELAGLVIVLSIVLKMMAKEKRNLSQSA
ncbi:hypothetical protein [Halobacillus andaensis]|uniref:hypothetical protein n=1 Tax=Halobacillus andaensis TaxID=1176239 RepID=UPI003D75C354